MRRLLFWGTTIVLLGAAVHIVTAVVVPRIERERTIEELMSAAPTNQLTVVDPKKRGDFALKGIAADLAIAICPYDVSTKALSITAPLPPAYWSISIFGLEGQNIYTINDSQVGTDKFAATIVLEKEETEEAGDSTARQGEGIVIKSKSEKGLVLLRTFVSDLAAAQRTQAVLSKTVCAEQETS